MLSWLEGIDMKYNLSIPVLTQSVGWTIQAWLNRWTVMKYSPPLHSISASLDLRSFSYYARGDNGRPQGCYIPSLFLGFSMAIHGHPWPFMAIHGHPWPSMAIHGPWWLSEIVMESWSSQASQRIECHQRQQQHPKHTLHRLASELQTLQMPKHIQTWPRLFEHRVCGHCHFLPGAFCAQSGCRIHIYYC